MLKLVTTQQVTPDGLNVLFNDVTGQTSDTAYGIGGNIFISAVNGVRIKVGTATTLLSVTSITTGNFVQFTEYLKIGGASSVVNGKILTVGSYFVSQIAGLSVPAGDIWQLTGYYVPQIILSWLPTATQVPLTLSINKLGQVGSLVEDNEYLFVYEVYAGVFAINTASILNNTYMVLTGSATYNASTYYPGERFTGIDTNTITVTGSVAILNATSNTYATLVYSLETGIMSNIYQKAVNADNDYTNEIYGLKSQLNSLKWASSTLNVDFNACSTIIKRLSNRVTYLNNNNL